MLIILKCSKFVAILWKVFFIVYSDYFLTKMFICFSPHSSRNKQNFSGVCRAFVFHIHSVFSFYLKLCLSFLLRIQQMDPCCRGMKNKNEQKLFLFVATVDIWYWENVWQAPLCFHADKVCYVFWLGVPFRPGKFFSCAIESYLAGTTARLEMRTLSNSVACHIVARYACKIVAHKPSVYFPLMISVATCNF